MKYEPWEPVAPGSLISVTGKTVKAGRRTLWQIMNLEDFNLGCFLMMPGEPGGYVEHPELIDNGCWVEPESELIGNVHLTDNAFIGANVNIQAASKGDITIGKVGVHNTTIKSAGKVHIFGDYSRLEDSYIDVPRAQEVTIDLTQNPITGMHCSTQNDFSLYDVEFTYYQRLPTSLKNRQSETKEYSATQRLALTKSVEKGEWAVNVPFAMCELFSWEDFMEIIDDKDPFLFAPEDQQSMIDPNSLIIPDETLASINRTLASMKAHISGKLPAAAPESDGQGALF